MLRMVECADDLLGQCNMWMLVLAVDLMTAVILSCVAVETRRYLLQHQAAEQQRYNTYRIGLAWYWYWGIGCWPIFISIAYWVIFILAVIPNTNTDQRSWCQQCSSCQQMMAVRLGRRWSNRRVWNSLPSELPSTHRTGRSSAATKNVFVYVRHRHIVTANFVCAIQLSCCCYYDDCYY